MKIIPKRKSKTTPEPVIQGQVIHFIDHKSKSNKYHYLTLGASVASFAVIGSFLVFSSFAAVRKFAAVESESGARSGNVTIKADTTAVGGNALRFDAPSVTPPPAGWTPKYPGEPKPGTMYYGSSIEGGNIGAFETAQGVKIGIFRSYFQSNDSVASLVNQAKADVNAKRIPLISTKLPDSWANMAAGKQDAWLLARIQGLAALNGPVWLSLHHEPWSEGGAATAADWAKMQQHARTLIKSNSSNIALIGILNGFPFTDGSNVSGYNHPVGTGVDVMGFDSYNPWSQTNGKKWRDPTYVFDPGIQIKKWGYPTLVGEYGVRDDPSSPGKAAQWMRDSYSYALSNNFVAISYFNSGQNSPDGPWTLSGERLQVFKENLSKTTTAHIQ